MFYDFGWEDLPLVVTRGDGTQELRWYSPTDPKFTIKLWGLYRDQRAAMSASAEARRSKSAAPSKATTIISEEDVKGLQVNPPPLPRDVPWTVTYTIDVLNRGEDDFSPSAIYFDFPEQIVQKPDPILFGPKGYATWPEVPFGKLNIGGKNVSMRFGPPHIGMDGSFFPLREGTRTKLKIKMAPTQYQNVHYTWGWRKHPPRAQAVENLHKRIPPRVDEFVAHYKLLRLDSSFCECRAASPPRFPRRRRDSSGCGSTTMNESSSTAWTFRKTPSTPSDPSTCTSNAISTRR